MLTLTRNLVYEDIAKLNPFYEELNNIWNAPYESESGPSSAPSLKTTASSGSFYSNPASFSSFEESPSPIMHRFPNPDHISVSDSPYAPIYSVNKHKPFYADCESCAHSQFASFADDDDFSPRYSFVETPSTLDGSDLFDFRPLEVPSKPKNLSRKKLFGENGWLGKTAEAKECPDKRKSNMLKGLGKKIRQHVEDIVSCFRSARSRLRDFNRSLQAVDMVRPHPHTSPFAHGSHVPKLAAKSNVPISLDSFTQAKLYSDMELMICSSANHFLVGQHRVGRVSRESIKKVNNFWGSKNRPQVVEFQFDQATQRQLVLSNIRTLDFHGESATNPILLRSNLQNWKAIVKEMNVRTFCLPDSAVRKHMYDIHKILDMLGAPLSISLAFQELQTQTLSLMREEMKKSHHRRSYHSVSSGVRSAGHASFLS